jgi:hypothetical protein
MALATFKKEYTFFIHSLSPSKSLVLKNCTHLIVPIAMPDSLPLELKDLVRNRNQMELKQSILKVMAYFDLFDYPVTKDELLYFLDNQNVSAKALMDSIDELKSHKCIFQHKEFYCLQSNHELAERRITGTNAALLLLPKARKISKFLYQFPYARAICISGSLSKTFALKNDDIDYFIIAKANRLWIARTFMHLLKKLSFLFGRQHWYCMNYFIDEEALEIEEKNIFTAMEMTTLLPVCGNGAVDAFFNANNWANTYYPNYRLKSMNCKPYAKDSLVKRGVELMLNNKMGDWLDTLCMRLTKKRWEKKEREKRLNMKGKSMGVVMGKHVAKPNSVFFQTEIVSRYFANLKMNLPKWDR